jgi:hypothetical protein
MRWPGYWSDSSRAVLERRREEGPGDKADAWGPADYFFETDDRGTVLRHVQVYANGTVLR